MVSLQEIEGRKFCVVFVKVLDEKTEKVQLQCMRGRACVDKNQVFVVDENGCRFGVPAVAQRNILPSDGTPLLKDAEYYCLVKVDPQIPLAKTDEETFL